jgi:hypothetical protein
MLLGGGVGHGQNPPALTGKGGDTAARTFASVCQVSSTVVSVDEVAPEVAVSTLARSAVRAFVGRELKKLFSLGIFGPLRSSASGDQWACRVVQQRSPFHRCAASNTVANCDRLGASPRNKIKYRIRNEAQTHAENFRKQRDLQALQGHRQPDCSEWLHGQRAGESLC